jgi:hypothetical protein
MDDGMIKTAAEAHEADAMPRQHEVHCDPETPIASRQPVPNGVTKTPVEPEKRGPLGR